MDIDKVLDAYDDDDAIKFIQANLPDEAKQMFTDDDIQYFLDIMYILDDKCVIDPDEFKKKFLAEAAKDEVTSITADNLEYLMDAEAKYFESLAADN